MSYLNTVLRVLKLDETVYPEISKNNRTLRFCVLNVFILGILYGFFSLYFNKESFNIFSQPTSLLIIQGIVLLTGIAIAFFMHAGASLLIWVFTRGIGGTTNFLITYLNVGISVVPLWFAVPGLTALQAGIVNPAIFMYTSLTGALSFLSIFTAAKSSSGLAVFKMSVAMAVTVIFITCFLYLWV